jgi:uncharacterized membrane protein YccF (DUF307 family)
MKLAANLIWVAFAGIWLCLGYIVAGLVSCLFIITIPFGVQSFKLASFVAWPFGRTTIDTGRGTGSGCLNLLWIVCGGWWLALLHVVTGLILCIPVITIPFAVQNFKLAALALAPFGKRIVTIEQAEAYLAAGRAAVSSG